MNPENNQNMDIEQIDNPEKYGRNVEVNVFLLRHAEKTSSRNLSEAVGPATALSDKGIMDAENFGRELKDKHPELQHIKVYHSGVNRAETTGRLIAGEDSIYSPRKRKSLALEGKITQDAFNILTAEAKAEGGSEATMIQKLLDANETPLDDRSMTSTEIGQIVASNILRMVEMSRKFLSNSKANIVFISHAGVIEHFLVDLLKAERQNFIADKLSGGLEYLEGPEISIKRKDKDQVSLNVKFRDYDFSISEDELRKLSGK